MPAGALGKRFLQSRAKVHAQKLKFAKNLTTDDWQAIQRAIAELSPFKVAIDTRSSHVADIAVTARRMASKWGGPLSLIVVDYLQLMDCMGGHGRGTSFARAVGHFAWGLKQLAMDLGTPVLVLSQLNREGAKKDRPPSKHDLKESGDIENHANVVLLLYRLPDSSADFQGEETVWCRVAKARDGLTTPWEGTGALRLLWRGGFTRFDDTWPEVTP